MEIPDMQEVYRQLSVDCFNRCWTFMSKPDRSEKDVEEMLLLAGASLWHWTQRTDCAPTNLSIGYWQMSRAHALAGHYETSRFFAERCVAISRAEKLPPFYVGYAYEALARARVLRREFDLARADLVEARRCLRQVTDKEEIDLLEPDLAELEKAIRAQAGGKP
jgi:hypothetical protein